MRELIVFASLAALACVACGPAPGSGQSRPLPTGTSAPSVTPRPTPTAAPTAPPTPKPTAKPLAACRLTLTKGQDGNAGPLFCSDGRINQIAWDYFAPVDPRVMSLSGDASFAQFQAAFCADLRGGSTKPIEISGVELAGRQHGWRFPTNNLENASWPDNCY